MKDQTFGEKAQTFGEKAVGLSFNPSGDSDVDRAKQMYAHIIDQLHGLRQECSPEKARLYSIAITEAQAAQMWAVKAITWKDEGEEEVNRTDVGGKGYQLERLRRIL